MQKFIYMKNNIFNERTLKFATNIVRFKWIYLSISVLIVFLCSIGFGTLSFNADSKVFFSPDNPQLQAYEKIEKIYTDDDNVLIAIANPTGETLFQKEILSEIKKLVEESWQTPFSFRVDAVTNFQYTRASEDELIVTDLVEDVETLSQNDLQTIQKIALNEPFLKNRLINKDASVVGINITTKIPKDATSITEVVNHIRKITNEFSQRNQNLKVYISGNVFLDNAFSEAAQDDGSTLIPIVFGLFLVMIYFSTRSFASTISGFLIVIFSIASALGLSALLGIELTAASANTPIVIATLAIADSIHICITILTLMKEGFAKNDAIIESIRVNIIPVSITSLTTIIGFLSLNTGDVPPYADFGNISAIGMTFALLFSIFTLPSLLAIIPFKVKVVSQKEEVQTESIFTKLGFWTLKNHIKIVISTLIILPIGIFFSMKNDLNDEFIKYFDDSIKFRTDTDFINENLTGIYNLELSIPAKNEGLINEPFYLNKLEEFAAFVEKQPEVIHVSSFSEVSKRVNKAMNADQASFYKVPENREMAAQYLLLYELSLPYGLDLNNQVNNKKSETRFTITLKEISSKEMIQFASKIESWLEKNCPKYMHTKASSFTLMFAHIGERQVMGLISGAIISAILITLILMLTFKSFKLGIISLFANVLPAMIGFGIWYFVLGYINLGMTAVFGMTLGIIVDNSIHFISKYNRGIKEMNLSVEDAMNKVGKAIVATTSIICVGFFVLTQSAFLLNSSLALITIIILLLSMIICLTSLPAFLMYSSKIKTLK